MQRAWTVAALTFSLVAAAAGCQSGGPAPDAPAEPAAAAAASGAEATTAGAASLAAGAASFAAVTSGQADDLRLLGYAKLANGQRLPATMDLVSVVTPDLHRSYRAVLKLAAGGFASHEYAAVYFANVSIDAATGRLSFAGGPDDVALTDAAFSRGMLHATVSSSHDASSAYLELRQGLSDEEAAAGSVDAGAPVTHQVTGVYHGACNGAKATLQLEASKWRTRRDAATGLFGSYRLTGRLSRVDAERCTSGQACVLETYSGGAMNLLSGAVELRSHATAAAKSCTLTNTGIRCGECNLTRDPASAHAVVDAPRKYAQHARTQHLSDASGPASAGGAAHPEPTPQRSGQYYGYLHHEGRDAYQLVALNINAGSVDPEALGGTKPPVASSATPEHIEAVATLYFGEGDSSEFIAYRFKDSILPAPHSGATVKHAVLDGDGEAFLVLDSWGDGVVKGTWYSKTYGRVGTVELQRDVVPAFGRDADGIEQVSGVYKGDDWQFELAAAAGVSDQDDDFYPLKLFGTAREAVGGARNRAIDEGTYDFYTGSLAFRLDDGRIAVGRVTKAGVQLQWPPKPRLGTPLGDGKTKMFTRLVDTARGAGLDRARGGTPPLGLPPVR